MGTGRINLSIVLSIMGVLPSVSSHGRLIDPPNRASMWRYGFDNPEDYQDNELYCGGQKYQWEVMNGRCGFCGDPYDQNPRAHEAGGKFANGIIVATYEEGATIKATLDITAAHKGWFEFRICPVNNKKVRVTQSCLDRYLLKYTDGQTRYYVPKTLKSKEVTVTLVLPRGLTCSQCVLQWKYHTGKDWGCDKPDVTSSCCIGCGPQEEFYGCSDVAIVKRGQIIKPVTSRTRTPLTRVPTTRAPRTRAPTTRAPRTRAPTTRSFRTRTPTTKPRTIAVTRTTRAYTARRATSKRTLIWQRTTKKPVTKRVRYTTRVKVTPTSKPTNWWHRPTKRAPYTPRPTTRAPQDGRVPKWTWGPARPKYSRSG